jgi:hypothetical protein
MRNCIVPLSGPAREDGHVKLNNFTDQSQAYKLTVAYLAKKFPFFYLNPEQLRTLLQLKLLGILTINISNRIYYFNN